MNWHPMVSLDGNPQSGAALGTQDLVWATLAVELQVSSPTPLYRRLSTKIQEWAETGRLQPGDRLPSERQMTQLLRISRRTIRTALAELIELGYVMASHGCGNFVLDPPHLRRLRLLALEGFVRTPGGIDPAYYDLIHRSEAANNAEVHYKYVPDASQLWEIITRPPTGYQAILLFRPPQHWQDELLARQKEYAATAAIPFLVVGRDLRPSRLNFVTPDYFVHARSAAEKLLAAGHRRIGYISGSQQFSYLQQSHAGYSAALREAGLVPRTEDQIHFENFDSNEITAALVRFLGQRKFSAVVVAGSRFAMDFEKAVSLAGVAVPDSLSAAVICENFIVERLGMPWTAFAYADEALADRCLHIAGQLARAEIGAPVQELLPPLARPGATCAPPNPA